MYVLFPYYQKCMVELYFSFFFGVQIYNYSKTGGKNIRKQKPFTQRWRRKKTRSSALEYSGLGADIFLRNISSSRNF
jgi:hypothetical protein